MAQFDLNNIPEEPTTGAPAPQYDLSKIPDTQVDLNSIPEEQAPSFLQKAQSAIGDTVVQAGSFAANPIGGVTEIANQIPGVKDYIPDFLAHNNTAKGGVKGVYNAAQHTAQLGADIQDFLIPGAATPVSDLLNTVAPEAKYDGATQAISGTLTEIAAGFMVGNRVAAIESVAGVTRPIAEKVATLANKTAGKLGTLLWNGVKGGLQGILGTTATVAPQENGVLVGEHPLVNVLGLDGFTKGLPIDSPDAAQNALSARVNMAIDSFIIGAGITEAAAGLKALHDISIAKVVTDKLKPAFSQAARIKAFFQGIEGEVQKIKGVETPEQLKAAMERMATLAGNTKAGQITADFGIPGVETSTVPLDTATTVSRQVDSQLPNALDQGIKNTLIGEAKKLSNSGYEGAQNVREGPVNALGNALDQTKEALGGTPSATLGAEKVKELGNKVVQEGKIEHVRQTNKMLDLGENITENVNRAESLRTEQLNKLYKAIPEDAGFNSESLMKIAEDHPELPKDILETIDNNDGTFKYLYNKLRPKISEYLAKNITPDQEFALKKLRDNIDSDQMDYLIASGRQDVVDAAEKAKEFYTKTVAPNRQGTLGDLKDIESKGGLNRDEILTKSQAKIDAVTSDPTLRRYRTRLQNVLSSEEGGKSEILLKRFTDAKDKAEELSHIEDEVYGNKLRNFFERVGKDKYEGLPNSEESFKKLLEDPQGLDRVQYITKLAEDSGDKSIPQALKFSYAKALRDRLYPGHITSLGNKAVSSQQIHSTLNDSGFIRAGQEIYKDTPEFMDTVGDLLKISDEIEKHVYLRPNLKNASDYVSETAKKALTKVTNVIYGPLSHRSLQAKTFFSALLEILDPQVAMGRTADALMTNGELFAHAYAEMANPKVSSQVASTSMKILANTIFHNQGERDKFDKAAARIRADLQTQDALGNASSKGVPREPLKLTVHPTKK